MVNDNAPNEIMSLTATSTSPTDTLRQGDLGTHASRTFMLAELGLLFEAVPASANEEGYLHAVLDDNVLLKRTIATRGKSLRHLRELYGLTSRFVLFGPLRELWAHDAKGRPLLALLTALVQDGLLRATGGVVLEAQAGALITAEALAAAVEQAYPNRLAPAVLAKVGRNTGSSCPSSIASRR